MSARLTLICVYVFTLVSCSPFAHWHYQRQMAQLEHTLIDCEHQRQAGQSITWTATVQCGNDKVHHMLAAGTFRHQAVIEAALLSRLRIAQQMDAGMLSADLGTAQINALTQQMLALPGSLMTVLELTTHPESGHHITSSPHEVNDS